MNHSTCCEKCRGFVGLLDKGDGRPQAVYDCDNSHCPCHQPTQECDCEVMAGMKAHTMVCVFGKQSPQEEGWEKEFEMLWVNLLGKSEISARCLSPVAGKQKLKAFFARKIAEARAEQLGKNYQHGYINGQTAERERILAQLGFMRQWLNEERITDPLKMVATEELAVWLRET